MQSDKTTLKDLSVFAADENGSIFGLLAHTTTQAGKDMLRRHIQSPPATHQDLMQMQLYQQLQKLLLLVKKSSETNSQ